MDSILSKIFNELSITQPTEEETMFVESQIYGGKADNTYKSQAICYYLKKEDKEKLVYEILENKHK